MEKNSVARQEKYIWGLDGLRAMAIVMVLSYHLRLPFAKGGLLGVTIFFVLSGFLITRSLIKEIDHRGTIRVRRFWMERIKRLYPAMIVMIIILVLMSAATNRLLFTKTCHDIPSALLGYNNWWQIYNNVSYFNRTGIASPLMHFWSLAIELQFYLFYPFLIVLISKIKKDHHFQAGIVLILGIIMTVYMCAFFNPAEDLNRIYFGTDTRIFSLLLGAVPAFLEKDLREYGNKKKKTWISAGAFIALFIIMVAMDGYNRGIQIVVTVLSVILVSLFVDKRNKFGRAMSIKPLHWLASRSYGIYIWHFPIILLISKGKKSSALMMLLEIVLILAVSELSYRLIEMPIRKGVIRKTVRRIKKHPESDREKQFQLKLVKKVRALAVTFMFFVLASVLCVAFVPRKSASVHRAKSEVKTTQKEKKEKKDKKKIVKGYNFLFVGDSVAEDAADAFNNIFPDSTCDTKIGRNAYEAPGIVKNYMKEYEWDGDAVILSVAINGPLNNSLEEVRKTIGKVKPLFIITGRAPYERYEESNNKKIHKFAKETKHTYVIDWYKYSKDHPEYFDQDETHLLPKGGEAYANCIKEEVLKVFSEKED